MWAQIRVVSTERSPKDNSKLKPRGRCKTPSIKRRNEGEEHHYVMTESRTLRIMCRGAGFSGRNRLRNQKEKRKRA